MVRDGGIVEAIKVIDYTVSLQGPLECTVELTDAQTKEVRLKSGRSKIKF